MTNIGFHDVGSLLHRSEPICTADKELKYWEKCIHSLLVVLATKSPPLITTDELRRGVENLEENIYKEWGYYERWSASMTTILLERGVLSQLEFDKELIGESIVDNNETIEPFKVGDIVSVKHEDTRCRWRKPHLRCPGYIFGCTGRVERFIGSFKDPFFLAFRGEGPLQHLYTVSFFNRDIWQYFESNSDSTTVEIYHGWLTKVQNCCESNVRDEHIGALSCDNSTAHNNSSNNNEEKQLDDNGHNHEHNHEHNHDHDYEHDVSDGHSHTHLPRIVVEQNAVGREIPDTLGQLVGEALLRALVKKRITTLEEIRRGVEKLDDAGKRLDGATLVLKAWLDPEFKNRLLLDAPRAALELGIVTSNPNAPTVLRVVENTDQVHNLIVCTLCSCYPSSLLGIAPSWYKSTSYRARAVREPRKVLAEFGTFLEDHQSIQIHDSTADCRYLVIPKRPLGTENWSESELRAIITRDTMVGVALCNLTGN